MNTTVYYWAGFIGYSLIVIYIGFAVWLREKKQNKQNDSLEFWAAGKNLSASSIGLSISASMMSISWSGVYGVQLFYWYGTGGAWLLIIPWLITMAGFYFLVPTFRKFDIFSQPALLEKHFGKNARLLLAPALIVVFITWTGGEIYAAGNIIAPFLHISPQLTFLLIAMVVAAYSYSGGFEAVVSTDKIQFVLVAVFITLIAGFAWFSVPGGIDIMSLPPEKVAQANFFSPGWALIFITLFAYLPGWLIESDLWVRVQAAKSNRAARQGILIAGINSFLFVGLMPMIIGLSALYLFPPVDGQSPAFLKDGALIFTEIMNRYAPVWLNTILSVGLIAAAMSTIDTCGNIVALSVSHDMIEPRFSGKLSADKLQFIARLASVGAIFIGYIYALFTDSLWDIFYLSSGILTTTVFIPVISSFRKNVSSLQVNTAMISGLIFTIIFYMFEKNGILNAIEPDFIQSTGLGYIVWAFGLTTLLYFLTGKFFKKL